MRARTVAARSLLVLIGALVGLVAGEIGLRVLSLPKSGPFLQEFRGPGFRLMAYDTNPTGAFDLDLSDDALRERLAARLENPDELRERWRETPWAVTVELDRSGFRERKIGPKRPGVRRVVVVGDSFTAGHGLPEALAYPRLLEARLQRAFEHERGTPRSGLAASSVEVLNLGRGDTDLPGIERSARWALRQLAPDLLIYGYFMNDPIPGAAPRPESPIHDMLDEGWTRLERSPTSTRIGQSVRGRLRIVDLVKRFFADRSVTNATIAWYRALHEPAAWQPTLERIAALAERTRDSGGRFVLLLLPLPFEIADSPFAEAHRAMRASAEAAGVEVVDALPALARHPDDALRLHPRDRHPSPLYTRVVAELLEPVALDALASPAAGRERSGR